MSRDTKTPKGSLYRSYWWDGKSSLALFVMKFGILGWKLLTPKVDERKKGWSHIWTATKTFQIWAILTFMWYSHILHISKTPRLACCTTFPFESQKQRYLLRSVTVKEWSRVARRGRDRRSVGVSITLMDVTIQCGYATYIYIYITYIL